MKKLFAILSVVLFANQASADAQKNCEEALRLLFQLAMAKAPYEVMIASVRQKKELLKDPEDWNNIADEILVRIHSYLGHHAMYPSKTGPSLINEDKFYKDACELEEAKYWK